MIVSLNEIETLARKAAVGAGLPAGAAEDFGAAVRALAENSLRAEHLARDALTAFDAGRSADARPEQSPEGWRLAPPAGRRLAACLAGPAAADIATAFRSADARVVLLDLDVPAIVAGALAAADGGRARDAASWRIAAGAAPAFWIADRSIAAGPAAATAPTLAIEPAAADTLPAAVRGAHAAPTTGIPVDPDAWAALDALAARCLVPASDASRARGAGAGLVDAD